MAGRKLKDGDPVIKKYKVLTPIRISADEVADVGKTFDLDEDDAAELVKVGALEEA